MGTRTLGNQITESEPEPFLVNIDLGADRAPSKPVND